MVAGARTVDLGVTRAYWVAASAITAFPTIPLTAVSAGVELTNFLLTSYKVALGASKTVNEMSVGDLADINVPTIRTYTGNLVLFRSILATGAPGTDDVLSTFGGNNESGYFVRRVGPLKSQALAVGDLVEAYKFVADAPEVDAGTGSGYLKVTVPLLSSGSFVLAQALS